MWMQHLSWVTALYLGCWNVPLSNLNRITPNVVEKSSFPSALSVSEGSLSSPPHPQSPLSPGRHCWVIQLPDITANKLHANNRTVCLSFLIKNLKMRKTAAQIHVITIPVCYGKLYNTQPNITLKLCSKLLGWHHVDVQFSLETLQVWLKWEGLECCNRLMWWVFCRVNPPAETTETDPSTQNVSSQRKLRSQPSKTDPDSDLDR